MATTHATNTNISRCISFSLHTAQALHHKEQTHWMNVRLWPNHDLSQRILLWAGSVSYFHNGLWSRIWISCSSSHSAIRFLMASPAYLAMKSKMCTRSSVTHLPSRKQGRRLSANTKWQSAYYLLQTSLVDRNIGSANVSRTVQPCSHLSLMSRLACSEATITLGHLLFPSQ